MARAESARAKSWQLAAFGERSAGVRPARGQERGWRTCFCFSLTCFLEGACFAGIAAVKLRAARYARAGAAAVAPPSLKLTSPPFKLVNPFFFRKKEVFFL